MASTIPEVTDATFQSEVLESELPVLVEFTAAWCGPCKAIVPTLEGLMGKHAGRLKVIQVDTEVSRSIAERYRVMAMPTMIVFQKGQPVGQLVGAHKDKLVALAAQFAS
ncbi:MAG: thioredoxin [Deltaproteobacteria bacterium]|nr:thioredoxin [Deltaproteobacteria bacterium]